MYDLNTQSVLRCGQCNKPFNKESTLKRHGYYCRSRRVTAEPRLRSCIACAKGKVRCDGRRPGCSRCASRAADCHYPVVVSSKTASVSELESQIPTTTSNQTPFLSLDAPPVEAALIVNSEEHTVFNHELFVSDIGFADPVTESLDWDNTDLDFADLLHFQAEDEDIEWLSPDSSSLVYHAKPSYGSTLQLLHQAISSPAVLLPTIPSYSRRSLVQRSKLQGGTQRITNLLLHTLKSYPLMMMRHNTLPPFIHPSLLSLCNTESSMEPLSNCLSLVHMISSGAQGSRKLFWKNVRMECERLREDHLKLNKWELLAAMQALSVYVLIRMDEGETDHNNLDFLLVVTIAAIAKQFNSLDATYDEDSAIIQSGPDMDWKEWIFQESRQRLAVIFRIVNLLIHFEPAAMCTLQKDLILAPLPARKQLWEATNDHAWKEESRRLPGLDTGFALAADGELVKLDKGQLHRHDKVFLYKPVNLDTASGDPASWEEWCAGMDGLGALIMLAASLAG